jgi:glutaredoxin
MKLYYFDAHGKGDAIRALLHIAKVEFEDVRLDKEGFEKLKAEGKFEFNQVPVVEHDGKTYA